MAADILLTTRRKFTAKKNKTWDGDGIVSSRGGYAYLQDISGRDMGRIMLNTSLEPGTCLSIGGKEVEIESSLSKQEYLSGRPFLNNSNSSNNDVQDPLTSAGKNKADTLTARRYVIPKLGVRTKVDLEELKESAKKTLNVPAPRSSAMNTAFKNPLKDDTVMQSSKSNANNPIPRHDPGAPGAIVMKRPSSVPQGKQIVDVVLDPLLGKHLREHQREGVKFLYECVMGMRPFNGEGAILADEMGLGKTLQTIALLWTLLKQNPIYGSSPIVKKALIVCPVTLINNWQKEFRKWLGNERLGVFVADGKRTRLTDFTKGRSYNVMIIGYERLRSVQDELTKGSGIDIVVADEGHRLKTVQNKSAQAIQSLNTPRRIILSGTPIQNELSEFFAMVDFVNPGLLGTFKSFMKEFEGPIVQARQPGASKKAVEKGEARSEELASLTTMFILRRTADILSKHLPPKTEYVLFCNPTNAQANIYRHMLASPVFQSTLGSSESALQLITLLKKVCNSPSLINNKSLDDGNPSSITGALLASLPPNLLRHFSPASSGKIRVLDQLLHNLRTKTSEKVILVSNYTSTLTLLANLLSSLDLPFLRLDGSTPSSKRQSLVDDFNTSSASSCFAFLLSAKAGGTGLNLIGASRLILFDVDWNPATDMQAMARIHRDGQKRHCRIYRFLLKGGLEEKIWQRQVTKIGLADSVMDKKGGTSHFSKDELRDLFRLDENSQCQTHELLGCDCGGRGKSNNNASQEGNGNARMATSHTSDHDGGVESDDDDNDSDDDSDFPELPLLIKASDLSRDDGQNKPTKKQLAKRRAKMRFLMQYSHIDPKLLASNKDAPGEDDGIKGEEDDESLESQIDDEALVSLLKEEGNRVGFLFKKDGFSGEVSASTGLLT